MAKTAVTRADVVFGTHNVGPAEHLDLLAVVDAVDVTSVEALSRWLAGQDVDDRAAPFTYVITTDGILRIAPRRSEHVACAGGQDVLGACEIQFDHDASGWIVTDISNQSTGYCPDLDSWTAVAAALDRAGLRHPDGFTQPIVFRACRTCQAVNIVREDDFTCAVCGCTLPSTWNLDQP
jgi:hypothetical protein